MKNEKGGENCQPQNIFRCRVGKEETRLFKLRKFCKLHTFANFFFCYSASSIGHSDTGLYPLQGPATFLTFYFFKRLSISNVNAASSGKQYFQSRFDWASGISSIDICEMKSVVMYLFCGKLLRCKSIILSVDDSFHGTKNTCCGDGISLTFLAVMRCSLIFFGGVAVFRTPHVPLPEKFETGGFTLKTHKMFSVHTTPEKFEKNT